MTIHRLLIFLSCLIIISCEKENKVDFIKSYFAAHNRHDIEKALIYYSEDVVFELKGVWTKTGLADMRSLEEWDAALNSHLRLESAEISGDTVRAKVIESNDWFRSVGIDSLIHDPAVFVIRDGKLQHIMGYPSAETGQQVEAAMGKIFQWSAMAADSTVYELIREGQFIYSTESANKWMELFEKMKDSVRFN